MSGRKGVVLDANILLRAVLGRRVRHILETYEDEARFYSPEVCFEDVREYLPILLERRGLDIGTGMAVLESIGGIVEVVEQALYGECERVARERIGGRDPQDWPVVAVSLLLDLPIWTEDQDFFGSGVATWTTDRIELYLKV